MVNAAGFWGRDPLLVWNGDIVADLEPGELWRAHSGARCLATLVTQRRPSDSLLLLDEEGFVCGIDSTRRGKREVCRDPAGRLNGVAFNEISLLAPELRERMARAGPFDLIDALLEAVATGAPVRAFDAGERFWGTTGSVEQMAALEAALTGRPALLSRWSPGDAVS